MSSHSLEIPTYLPGKTNSSENVGSRVLSLPKGSCVLSGRREWLVSWTLQPASKDAGLQLPGAAVVAARAGGSSFRLGSGPVSLPAGTTSPPLSLSLAKATRLHEEGLLPSAKIMEAGANPPQLLGLFGPRTGHFSWFLRCLSHPEWL